jgi:hypothetical protein
MIASPNLLPITFGPPSTSINQTGPRIEAGDRCSGRTAWRPPVKPVNARLRLRLRSQGKPPGASTRPAGRGYDRARALVGVRERSAVPARDAPDGAPMARHESRGSPRPLATRASRTFRPARSVTGTRCGAKRPTDGPASRMSRPLSQRRAEGSQVTSSVTSRSCVANRKVIAYAEAFRV